MSQNTTVGAVLEQDHREIDSHFEAFAQALMDGRIEPTHFDAASEGLRHHIWVEEELHFPPLRAAGLLGPVLVMLREHGEIWDLLDRIEAALADGGDLAAARESFTRLAAVLGDHNMKEERILYPAGDAQLDPDTAEAIRSALATGTRPSGWACEMAGRTPH